MLSITMKELQQHVDILASDGLRGRETGTPGQWLAAKYLAREFESYGLQAMPGHTRYYQNFDLIYPHLRKAALTLFEDGHPPVPLSLQQDFVPYVFSGSNVVTAPLAFAGYGITAPEQHYDDYASIDVHGKIVLAFAGRPQGTADEHLFRRAQALPGGTPAAKAETARAHGAVAMLLLSETAYQRNTGASLTTWPLFSNRLRARHNWQLKTHQPITAFPAAQVASAALTPLFRSVGTSLRQWQHRLDRTLEPASFVFEHIHVHVNIQTSFKTRTTQNVVALLPGSDPRLRDEVVIIGAHYDHLGATNGVIFNGADDNASGTAGLLEIAEAFSKLPHAPRRSILFVAFSAEEMGLLGSQYYVDNPLFPLDKTVAMLNLDMIGRNEPGVVSVIGSERSRHLYQLNFLANAEIGLDLRFSGAQYFDRSDQVNFARKDIPVIFYNTDVHKDYHQASDTAEKINPRKIARISRLAFLVAWELANANQRPLPSSEDFTQKR